MTRRTAMAISVFVLIVWSTSGSWSVVEAQRGGPAARPNVLFIIADDLNDDMGAWGHPVVRTPNIDRLAARSVRFERAYTQYALCNPSRASFMTGLRPDTIRVYDLTTHFRANVPDAVTLPQMFQRAGYFAARVGKIYHYGNPGDIGTSGLDDKPSWNSFVNPRGVDKDEEPKLTFAGPSRALGSSLSYYASPAPEEAHTDGMVATETIKLIEKHKGGPFFIAAGFYRPHCPYIAPQKYFDLYPSLDRVPTGEYSELLLKQSPTASRGVSWDVPDKEQRDAIRAYYAAISFMDAQVGRLLDALERLKLRQNTIVVFMSDHGYHLGDHGGLWMKQSLFERSTRTPLMIAGPGVTAPGGASRRIVELIDIYPTLAALTGITPPPGLQGRSLRTLLGKPDAEWDHPALSQVRRVLTAGRGGARGAGPPPQAGLPANIGYTVRTELYRYITWDDGQVGEELFDEINDPGELRNLAGSSFYAGVLAEMRQLLGRARAARTK